MGPYTPPTTSAIGRPPGSRHPVYQRHRLPGKSYCTECHRELNTNNRSGLCRGCAPHSPVLPTKKCFEPRGHRWKTKGHTTKRCVHCGTERPFTAKEKKHG